jgi:hypothetical protein
MGSPDKLVADKKLQTLEKKLIQTIQKEIGRQLESSGEIRKILQKQLGSASNKTTKSSAAGKK